VVRDPVTSAEAAVRSPGTNRRGRAAHFVLHPELATSPPNEALISAVLRLGFDVDVFAPPEGPIVTDQYGPRVRAAGEVEYGLRFLARNVLDPRWQRYRLFSGTTEDPIGLAGPLSVLARAPLVVLADEIYSGSYAGNRANRWKALCRWGMRRAVATIVNDASRVALQREYAGLAMSHPFAVYPGCFRHPPAPLDRALVRQARGIPAGAFVVGFSGNFNTTTGAPWAVELLARRDDLYVWGQLQVTDRLVKELLPYLRNSERLITEPRRLSWKEAWESIGAADVGLALYLHDGPQFRNMGTSSNRLCMFLAMGVPVIATRQPSFQFVEDYGCGVLVDDAAGLVEAVDAVRSRREQMAAAAVRCAREYIDAPSRYEALYETLRAAGLRAQ
jgi:glycosyltransferase involved in cell wall biosynthesis